MGEQEHCVLCPVPGDKIYEAFDQISQHTKQSLSHWDAPVVAPWEAQRTNLAILQFLLHTCPVPSPSPQQHPLLLSPVWMQVWTRDTALRRAGWFHPIPSWAPSSTWHYVFISHYKINMYYLHSLKLKASLSFFPLEPCFSCLEIVIIPSCPFVSASLKSCFQNTHTHTWELKSCRNKKSAFMNWCACGNIWLWLWISESKKSVLLRLHLEFYKYFVFSF